MSSPSGGTTFSALKKSGSIEAEETGDSNRRTGRRFPL
jgi:hypothetical protein